MDTSKKRVLIVDDERMLLQSLKMVFETFGFETATASNGQEGLRLLEETEGDFDLVVTDFDYKDPEMDGLGFLEAIQGKSIPTIMHSATDGIRERATSLQAIFIDKSAHSFKDLRAAVEGMFGPVP
jgi:DNA-binding NtrC family response regulator